MAETSVAEPGDMTIDEVKDQLEDADADAIEATAEAERDRGDDARSTLIEDLEAMADDRREDDDTDESESDDGDESDADGAEMVRGPRSPRSLTGPQAAVPEDAEEIVIRPKAAEVAGETYSSLSETHVVENTDEVRTAIEAGRAVYRGTPEE